MSRCVGKRDTCTRDALPGWTDLCLPCTEAWDSTYRAAFAETGADDSTPRPLGARPPSVTRCAHGLDTQLDCMICDAPPEPATMEQINHRWSTATSGCIGVESKAVDGAYTTEWRLQFIGDTVCPRGMTRWAKGDTFAELLANADTMLAGAGL